MASVEAWLMRKGIAISASAVKKQMGIESYEDLIRFESRIIRRKIDRLLQAPYKIALDYLREGEYEKAMTLNGFLYCNALGFDTEPMMRALEAGIQGVTLSGTGPSYVALMDKNNAANLIKAWADYELSGTLISTKVNNIGASKL